MRFEEAVRSEGRHAWQSWLRGLLCTFVQVVHCTKTTDPTRQSPVEGSNRWMYKSGKSLRPVCVEPRVRGKKSRGQGKSGPSGPGAAAGQHVECVVIHLQRLL